VAAEGMLAWPQQLYPQAITLVSLARVVDTNGSSLAANDTAAIKTYRLIEIISVLLFQ